VDGAETSLVKLLIEHDADPNVQLQDGDTPLMQAARLGQADIVELLLQHGAQPDARHADCGYSALMVAANAGNIASVQHLLQRGVNANAAATYIGTENWIRPNGFSNGVGIIRGYTRRPWSPGSAPGRHDSTAFCGAPRPRRRSRTTMPVWQNC
jgi:ankyrin repeat protein